MSNDRIALLAIAPAIALLAAACGHSTAQPAIERRGSGAIATVVQAATLQGGVTRVNVTVSPDDVDQDLAYDETTAATPRRWSCVGTAAPPQSRTGRAPRPNRSDI
jgi:hypothetical protein